MRVALSSPISIGIRRIAETDVRLPPPDVDLTRPPSGARRGLPRLAWHLAQITDLPLGALAQLGEADVDAIISAYDEVLANVRAGTRQITRAMKG